MVLSQHLKCYLMRQVLAQHCSVLRHSKENDCAKNCGFIRRQHIIWRCMGLGKVQAMNIPEYLKRRTAGHGGVDGCLCDLEGGDPKCTKQPPYETVEQYIQRLLSYIIPQSAARRLDGKFSHDGTQVFNTVSGVAIPEDEPIFILRARDR